MRKFFLFLSVFFLFLFSSPVSSQSGFYLSSFVPALNSCDAGVVCTPTSVSWEGSTSFDFKGGLYRTPASPMAQQYEQLLDGYAVGFRFSLSSQSEVGTQTGLRSDLVSDSLLFPSSALRGDFPLVSSFPVTICVTSSLLDASFVNFDGQCDHLVRVGDGPAFQFPEFSQTGFWDMHLGAYTGYGSGQSFSVSFSSFNWVLVGSPPSTPTPTITPTPFSGYGYGYTCSGSISANLLLNSSFEVPGVWSPSAPLSSQSSVSGLYSGRFYNLSSSQVIFTDYGLTSIIIGFSYRSFNEFSPPTTLLVSVSPHEPPIVIELPVSSSPPLVWTSYEGEFPVSSPPTAFNISVFGDALLDSVYLYQIVDSAILCPPEPTPTITPTPFLFITPFATIPPTATVWSTVVAPPVLITPLPTTCAGWGDIDLSPVLSTPIPALNFCLAPYSVELVSDTPFSVYLFDLFTPQSAFSIAVVLVFSLVVLRWVQRR